MTTQTEILRLTKEGAQVFTRQETSTLTGISTIRLQVWESSDALLPHHIGHLIRYDRADLIVACVVETLRRKQVPLSKVRRLLYRHGLDRYIRQSCALVSNPTVLPLTMKTRAILPMFNLHEITQSVDVAITEWNNRLAVV